MAAEDRKEPLRQPTPKDTAQLLALVRRIKVLSLGDKLRFCAELSDEGVYEPIIETLLQLFVDELRLLRISNRAETSRG